MADLTLSQMLALLADNITGQISASDVQAVITALAERTDGTNPINGLLFDTTPDAVPFTPGHMHWNTTDGIAEIMSDVSGVTLQVGHEQWMNVRNTTGSTILNGRPVRITGGQGNLPLVAPSTGIGTLVGLATHDIPNNSNGKVTTYGLVRDLNTIAFAEGAELYGTAAGTLSTAISSSRVGFVLNSHLTLGSILVLPARRTNSSGTTAQRPTTVITSFTYFDTTLGIPIWWSGAAWVNSEGVTV